jgi:hypothetical protein
MKKYMRIFIMISLLAGSFCSAGPVTEFKTAGEWSEVTNGLRGRLLFAEGTPDKGGVKMGEVYLELQNVSLGDAMYVYYAATKSPLRCELSDAAGKNVEGMPEVMSDWMPSPCWLALPHDSALRFSTRVGPSFGPAHPCLFICVGLEGGAWEIPPTATNDYYLSGTFTVKTPANETRPRIWEGTLKLPRVRVPVK